jgi:hypothetical protein
MTFRLAKSQYQMPKVHVVGGSFLPRIKKKSVKPFMG